MHLHAMHLTNTTLVGSVCTDVHRVAKYVTVYDVKRAARAPAINCKITIATTLGHMGTNKTMGASIRRYAATHGYRTPHHPTALARVHRCLSIPWEQPVVARLDTPSMCHATIGQ